MLLKANAIVVNLASRLTRRFFVDPVTFDRLIHPSEAGIWAKMTLAFNSKKTVSSPYSYMLQTIMGASYLSKPTAGTKLAYSIIWYKEKKV